MKETKIVIVSLLLLALVGCGSNNADEIKSLSKENEDLKLKLETLETTLKSYEKGDSFTFKDEVESTFRVVDKIDSIDDVNFLVVRNPDTDHNSMMLLEIDDNEIFDSIEVDKEYDMKVYYIFVVEEENQHSRVEITFLEMVE